jgi:hypothetical protein
MIIMKRMVFSLNVEQTPNERRYLLVERACRESIRDLQIFRVAYHPENTFWRAGCPAFTI